MSQGQEFRRSPKTVKFATGSVIQVRFSTPDSEPQMRKPRKGNLIGFVLVVLTLCVQPAHAMSCCGRGSSSSDDSGGSVRSSTSQDDSTTRSSSSQDDSSPPGDDENDYSQANSDAQVLQKVKKIAEALQCIHTETDSLGDFVTTWCGWAPQIFTGIGLVDDFPEFWGSKGKRRAKECLLKTAKLLDFGIYQRASERCSFRYFGVCHPATDIFYFGLVILHLLEGPVLKGGPALRATASDFDRESAESARDGQNPRAV